MTQTSFNCNGTLITIDCPQLSVWLTDDICASLTIDPHNN